jgi:hypothetical protein
MIYGKRAKNRLLTLCLTTGWIPTLAKLARLNGNVIRINDEASGSTSGGHRAS